LDETTGLGSAEILPIDPIQCSIPHDKIITGGPGKDGIPALTNPSFVRAGDPELGYLRRNDRVVGLILDSGPLAIPLNIFWWHEIVNLDGVGQGMAITHCPLTGSSMAFQRSAVSGAEFGVTGLLYKNNLIMYDRDESESFWPQMLRGARCGARDGDQLPMVPVLEMTWEGWEGLFPETLVVSENTGFSRDYREYPYGDYDAPNDPFTLFPATIDTRRPPKERVLGIPLGSGGLALPFGLLDKRGAVVSVSVEFGGDELVVFWNRFEQAAMAYRPAVDNEGLTFSVEHGRITDDQTGSLWRVDGLATDGPLAGHRLQPMADAFVAFWFAWPEFYPEIRIWTEVQDH
jgi:hypothetical protein